MSKLFLWEDSRGDRRWESVKEDQTMGLLEKLIESGVSPATVMVAHSPTLFRWVWPKYHSGRSDVQFTNIDDEIYGSEPVERKRPPINIPQKELSISKYGWLSPDGRFFRCDYGGHSNLADKIVGEVQRISNPERYLEDLGWAKILHGGSTGRTYAVGMGLEKKLTKAQMQTLVEKGLDTAWGIEFLL